VVGKALYLAPGSEKWVEVAAELNYANGIGISPDQKTLYVSETVGNCTLKFKINDDGSLSNRSNFALLNLFTKNKVESWWLGPDSMKIDSKGNIYVTQWFGGKILKYLLTASFYTYLRSARVMARQTSPSAKARKNCA
jgi:gluconolactonase